MQRNIKVLHYVLLLIYSLFGSVILVLAKAPILAVAVVLFLGPLFIMWQHIDLRTRLIPLVALATVAVTAVVEIFAYTHGMWYELAPSDVRLFGTAPIEVYVFSSVYILYFIVVYEYFFDNQLSRVRTTYIARTVGLLGALLAVSLGYLYFYANSVVENAYTLLVGACLIVLAAVIGWRGREMQLSVLKRAVVFSIAMLPIGMINELILLTNDIRFFVHARDYLFTFSYFGYMVPFEEICIMLLLPMATVVLYEALIDDGK